MKIAVKAGILLITIAAVWGYMEWQSSRETAILQGALQKAERTGDWKVAEQVAGQLTLILPDDPWSWYALGQARERNQDFSGAAFALEHVAVEGPRGVDAALALMKLRLRYLNQPLESMKTASQLLQLDPKLSDPRRTRIYFYGMTLQRSWLLQDIYAAIEYRADLPEHYLTLVSLEELSFSDGDQVTEAWLQSAPQDPELKVAHLVQVARIAKARFLTAPSESLRLAMVESLEQVRQMLTEVPGSTCLLDVLLQDALENGNLDAAEKLLSDVSDSSLQDPMIWYWLGAFHRQAGDQAEAERALQQALQIHPLGWKARAELAQVLRATGRIEQAATQQALAAEGIRLTAEIRRLAHVSDASREFLLEIAEYAVECEDWQAANGIFRRYSPGAR